MGGVEEVGERRGRGYLVVKMFEMSHDKIPLGNGIRRMMERNGRRFMWIVTDGKGIVIVLQVRRWVLNNQRKAQSVSRQAL